MLDNDWVNLCLSNVSYMHVSMSHLQFEPQTSSDIFRQSNRVQTPLDSPDNPSLSHTPDDACLPCTLRQQGWPSGAHHISGLLGVRAEQQQEAVCDFSRSLDVPLAHQSLYVFHCLDMHHEHSIGHACNVIGRKPSAG